MTFPFEKPCPHQANVKLVAISDIHHFSPESEKNRVHEALESVAKNGNAVSLLGDFIDGWQAQKVVHLPDHHPLTMKEVEDILNFAGKNHRRRTITMRAQNRLFQGIPGMTCPRPVEGSVFQSLHKLGTLFIENCDQGGVGWLVDEIMEVLEKEK